MVVITNWLIHVVSVYLNYYGYITGKTKNKLTSSRIELYPDLRFRIPRRVLCARQRMLTLHEHLIPLLFCKGVREFHAFVPFVYVLSFNLFEICLVSLDYALLISRMGTLHWTYKP